MTEELTEPYFAETRPRKPIETEYGVLQPETSECWARELEANIREDPERFHYVLIWLGGAAASQRVNLRTIMFNPELDSGDATAAFLITRFFSARCDRYVSYDDQTEDAILGNEYYADTYTAHKNAQPQTFMKGKSSSGQRAHPDAERRSELMRSLRLESYIWQVIEWKAQQNLQRQAS